MLKLRGCVRLRFREALPVAPAHRLHEAAERVSITHDTPCAAQSVIAGIPTVMATRGSPPPIRRVPKLANVFHR